MMSTPDSTAGTTKEDPAEHFIAHHLEPGSRLGEILFGLIMVLTVTLTAGISLTHGGLGVHQLLITAVGCNLAWGIIDGVMFVIISLTERNGQSRFIESVQRAPNATVALSLIRAEVEPTLAPIVDQASREKLYQATHVHLRNAVVPAHHITRKDIIGGALCAGLVMSSCIPAVVPFFVFHDSPLLALRVSNGLLLITLFFVGLSWGQHMQINRWLAGAGLLVIGLALVGVAILFGG